MILSSVMPSTGVSVANAIQVLESQLQGINNLSGTDAYQRLDAYHTWAAQASSQLGYVFDFPTVEQLVHTRRHDFLFTMFGGPQKLLNLTISAEQEDRVRVLTGALSELQVLRASTKSLTETLVVADTNVYLHQDVPFQDLLWHVILDTPTDLRLFLPMAVMRELDRAKRTPGGKPVSFVSQELVRDRARRTSKFIRTAFSQTQHAASVSPGVTMEILADPRSHRPIEDPDSEIIDRSLALQSAAGRSVFVVTSDGNMQFGAGVAGLDALLLD